ncbi:MAG: protein translocase subunit SecD [Prochlorothrix sp.]|nr:protein translocase subunit SecD [Prochlorothrix sp.]
MGKQRGLLALIAVLVAGSIFILLQYPLQLGLDLRGGSQLTILVKPTEDIPEVTERELEAVIRVVENRVNGLGVSEPIVQSAGSDQILVQLPGVNDPEQAERVLGGTAQLAFREQLPNTEEQLRIERQILAEHLLERQQIFFDEEGRPNPNPNPEALAANQVKIDQSRQAIADLFKPAELTGQFLTDAGPQATRNGGWEIYLRFNVEGGDMFAELSKNLAGTGRSIGIFLDNELISSPVVGPEFAQAGITGGAATITGNFDADSANDLGIQLRGGSLPLPVEVVENRTVGASLGQESIRQSIYAGLGGLVLVLIFMVVYYRLPGGIANISLVVYTLLTLTAFNLLGVTLTLPGIAGFILSIGMAVDANVLIFERTREELKAGKSLYRSVESGFYRAFSSILDSNVTTLIACAALFYLGSGLVKGFALTLAIGVLTSMFTAITCCRTLLFTAISISDLRKPELFAPQTLISQASQSPQ